MDFGLRILDFPGRSAEHQLPPVSSAARPDIDDVVGAANDRLIMLDDDERVSLVAQGVHDVHQPAGVARMQPDGRLIHDEKRIHQRGAEAGREIHALDLAAGQRAGRAIERQIPESDLVQIPQPGEDLVL